MSNTSNRKKIIIILGLVLLVGISAGALFLISNNLSQDTAPEDTAAATNNCCGTPGYPVNCQTNADFERGWYDCEQGGCSACRAPTQCGNEECEAGESAANCPKDCQTGGGSTGGSGGGGDNQQPSNICANDGQTCSGDPIGETYAYDGGTCTCQLDGQTANSCACVPSNGSSCISNDNSSCSTVGSTCTKSGAGGTCISTGATSTGQASCICNVDEDADQPGNEGKGGYQCSSDAVCDAGYYCNINLSNPSCQTKKDNGNDCSRNGQCLSGVCQGTCVAPGNNESPLECGGDRGDCGDGQYCEGGYCRQTKPLGQPCTYSDECSSNVCRFNECRLPGDSDGQVDDPTAGGSCPANGQVYCQADNPGMGCPTGQGYGRLCSQGTLEESCTYYDACAAEVQPVQQGQSCAGLTQLSSGEDLEGGRAFVGCQGNLNCFCTDISNDSTATVTCVEDQGNDSCGASAVTKTSSSSASEDTTDAQSSSTTSSSNTTSSSSSSTTSSSSSSIQTSCNFLNQTSPSSSTINSEQTVNWTAEYTCTGLNNDLRLSVLDQSNNQVGNPTAASPGSANYESSTDTCTYTFSWDANGIGDGDYNVRLLNDGTLNSIENTAACQENLTLSSSTPEEPALSVVKNTTQQCVEDDTSDTYDGLDLDYTITITNSGEIDTEVKTITDNLPSQIDGDDTAEVINISPTPDQRTDNTLVWNYNQQLAVGDSIDFTYTVTYDGNEVQTIDGDELTNIVDVTYDDDDDDSVSYENTIEAEVCSELPDTGIFDANRRPLLIGLILIILGILFNRSRGLMNTIGLGNLVSPVRKEVFEKRLSQKASGKD